MVWRQHCQGPCLLVGEIEVAAEERQLRHCPEDGNVGAVELVALAREL